MIQTSLFADLSTKIIQVLSVTLKTLFCLIIRFFSPLHFRHAQCHEGVTATSMSVMLPVCTSEKSYYIYPNPDISIKSIISVMPSLSPCTCVSEQHSAHQV